MYSTQLTNRGILKVSGEDRVSFFQGLVTNDVRLVQEEMSLYTLLLTPQGRYLFDLFITQVGDEWWIEADRSRLTELEKKLKLYKLRSRVTFEGDAPLQVWVCWGEGVNDVFSLIHTPGHTRHTPLWHGYADPRLFELGVRILTKSPENCEELSQISRVSYEAYRYHRYGLGVPESEDWRLEKSIPLENGMEELRAINWEKGCYMGQELTARTRYRGLIRKRLFPLSFQGIIDPQEPIKAQGKDVGIWQEICQDRGIALVRLEAIHHPLFCAQTPLTLLPPHWMKRPEER